MSLCCLLQISSLQAWTIAQKNLIITGTAKAQNLSKHHHEVSHNLSNHNMQPRTNSHLSQAIESRKGERGRRCTKYPRPQARAPAKPQEEMREVRSTKKQPKHRGLAYTS
jgi:hypothetical protein